MIGLHQHGPDWLVAKVKPRQESRVSSFLGRHGVEAYAPQIAITKRGKQGVEPLFPGYLFVQVAPATDIWPIVRWAPGLAYFLPSREAPEPVASGLVAEIEGRVSRWNAGGWRDAFRVGDQIHVDTGPLRGLDALFQRYLPSQQRCEVLVSLIGRTHVVQVDVNALHSNVVEKRFAVVG